MSKACILAMVAVLLAVACNPENTLCTSYEEVVTESREPGPYSAVKLLGNVRLAVTIDPSASGPTLSLTGPRELLDSLSTTLEGDTLAVGFSFEVFTCVIAQAPTVALTLPSGSWVIQASDAGELSVHIDSGGTALLRADSASLALSGTPDSLYIELNGASGLSTDSLVAGGVQLQLNGTGFATLSGSYQRLWVRQAASSTRVATLGTTARLDTATYLDANLLGSGTLAAFTMRAGVVVVRLPRAANADVTCTDSLYGRVDSSGSLRYAGSPLALDTATAPGASGTIGAF